MSSKEQDKKEDPDIAIIKARKMKELWKQAALERSKAAQKEQGQKARIKTDREIVSDLLYDRGEEVLRLAEIQFPSQTRMIINRIADLTKSGEIQQRISGGELLMLFRSIGINVREIRLSKSKIMANWFQSQRNLRRKIKKTRAGDNSKHSILLSLLYYCSQFPANLRTYKTV
jgi:DNA-binding TFAR19-related protein (PDSD5 family)